MRSSRLEYATPPPVANLEVARNIGEYLTSSSVLRPAQVPVFVGMQSFFAEEALRGHVEAPTGSGKSVFIVELSKLLRDMPPDVPPPSILVVTPTKDLVGQLIGRAGKRGYGKFAPDLTVRSFFSDSTVAEKRLFTKADVGVTTYDSFAIIRRTPDFVEAKDLSAGALLHHYGRLKSQQRHNTLDPIEVELRAQEVMKRLKGLPGNVSILSKFNVILLDEAHHALEQTIEDIIRSVADTTTIVGFTATPEADIRRRLARLLPYKIHGISLLEGITSGMVAPVAPIGVASGMRIEGSNIYNEAGEFKDTSLAYLAQDPERNQRIVRVAKFLSGLGMRGLISCLAGNNMWHAKHIAGLLQEEGVAAKAVHGDLTTQERAVIYEALEHGDVEAMSFVKLLGEGYDSQRAQYIINGRPTRALIFAKQRPGRITRPGKIAVVVDIVDEYTADNMSITMADVLGKGAIPFGTVFGDLSAKDQRALKHILEELPRTVPVLPTLPNHYASHQEMLAKLPKPVTGRLIEDGVTYALAAIASPRYKDLTAHLLQQAAQTHDLPLRSLAVDRGGFLASVYSVDDARQILSQLPDVNPHQFYIDANRQKWLAPIGMIKLFQKRYPYITEDAMRSALGQVEGHIAWQVGRQVIGGTAGGRDRRGSGIKYFTLYRATPLYTYTPETIEAVDAVLQGYYPSDAA